MLSDYAVQRIRAHRFRSRLLGRRVRTGRVPKQLFPRAIEADYAQSLVSIVYSTKPAIDALLRGLPSMLESARAARHDANEPDRVRAFLDRARDVLVATTNPTELGRLIRRFANAAAAFQRAQLARQIAAALGIDVGLLDRGVPAMIDQFIAENVSLIRSTSERALGDVEKIVTRAFTIGAVASVVIGQVAERYAMHERHARLIARDQIGSLTGQINAARQQEMGVTHFRWRTVRDGRVRHSHRALELASATEPFRYDDPPNEGLPGEPIMCRCHAEPVFDDLSTLVKS